MTGWTATEACVACFLYGALLGILATARCVVRPGGIKGRVPEHMRGKKVLPPQGGSGTAPPIGRRAKCPESIDPKQGLIAVRPDRGLEYSHEAAHRNAGCKTCHGSGHITLPVGQSSNFPPPTRVDSLLANCEYVEQLLRSIKSRPQCQCSACNEKEAACPAT